MPDKKPIVLYANVENGELSLDADNDSDRERLVNYLRSGRWLIKRIFNRTYIPPFYVKSISITDKHYRFSDDPDSDGEAESVTFVLEGHLPGRQRHPFANHGVTGVKYVRFTSFAIDRMTEKEILSALSENHRILIDELTEGIPVAEKTYY